MGLRSKLFTWALATGLFMTGPAAHANTIFECTMNDETTNRGWLPTKVVVAYQEGAKKALVSDELILSVVGEPRKAEVKRDTEKRLTLEWHLSLRASNGMGVSFRYVFTIAKQSNTATINAFPTGYSNQFGSTGTCKVTKD
jgi:hypothetical protein